MHSENIDQRKPDSRWKVFLSTAKEFLQGFMPRSFLLILPLSLVAGLYRQGWNLQAVIDGIIFTIILMLAVTGLCVGFALHIALIYRKDRSYKTEA